MRRSTLAIGAEVLLLALQMAALLLILGLPDLRAAAAVVGGGVASAENTVALITALLWAGTVLLALVVMAHGIRAASRGMRSSTLLVIAVVVGACCLSAGIVRHQAAEFHLCCGSLARAQGLLDTNR